MSKCKSNAKKTGKKVKVQTDTKSLDDAADKLKKNEEKYPVEKVKGSSKKYNEY